MIPPKYISSIFCLGENQNQLNRVLAVLISFVQKLACLASNALNSTVRWSQRTDLKEPIKSQLKNWEQVLKAQVHYNERWIFHLQS